MSVRRLATATQRARETAEQLVVLARLTRDLPRFLRTPITSEMARARVVQRMSTRGQRLVALVERAMYTYPRSPYRQLLRHAGCELGDIRALVAAEGVEGALQILADRGVYLTYGEIKSREDLVRGSLRMRVQPSDIDNPLIRPHYLIYTSGSAGQPSRIKVALDSLEERGVSIRMALEAHGATRPAVVFWWPMPVPHIIMCRMLGVPVRAWYYPVRPLPVRARLAAGYVAALGRLIGRPLARPRHLDLSEATRMAHEVASHLKADGQVVLWTMASAAARVGAAATDAGLDLRGALFLTSGEPLTEARRRHIESSGARPLAQYSSAEASNMAFGCARPTTADDIHPLLDRHALAQRRRLAAPAGPEVDALLVTTLAPTFGKILLNAELGDYGRLEQRDCGCLLGELGMRTHISEIRSFEKLTGEGVTFARSNLEQIVEQVLPARFGGMSLDYQLSEEEAPDGAIRLVLRVNPSVGPVDETALKAALLSELGRGGPSEQYHAGIWRVAGTIEVRRQAPLPTRAGKVLPFQILRRANRETGASNAQDSRI